MSFVPIWPHRAVRDLAAAYLAGRAVGEGKAVTAATELIERELAKDPAALGESRAGNARVFFAPPLVIEFEVFEDEQVVVVTNVRFLQPRG